MAFRHVRSVWKTHPDNVRYPYLDMEVVWPAFVSMDNPNFLEAVHLIKETAGSGENAPTAPVLAADLAATRANDSLVELARHLELSTRKILADFFKGAAPTVSALGVEYPYLDKAATLQALHAAYRFIVETAADRETNGSEREVVIGRLQKTIEAVKRRHLGEITLSCLHLARTKQVPCRRATEFLPMFVFGHGSLQKRLFHGFSEATSYSSVLAATNKSVANEVMALNGLPVPRQRTVNTVEAARKAANELGFPVVVKPQSTDFGTAVETGIDNPEDLLLAFEAARRHGNVLVEEHIHGTDHRITVINGKAVRAYERVAAQVTGDGRRTVAELIDRATIERLEAIDLREYGFVRKDDPAVIKLLRKQNLDLGAVPENGRVVLLRTNANVSTGGTGRIVTEHTHPDNLKLAERAAAVLGLDIAGVDFICSDISVSWLESRTAICEVNPTPGMILPDDPYRLLDYMTGNGQSNLRVPIVFFFGSEEEIDATQASLTAMARSTETILSCVRSNVVLQNGRQLSKACGSLGPAIDIALSDHLTDALLVCINAGDTPDLSSGIDFADLAFTSQAFEMATGGAALGDVNLPHFLKVMRGGMSQFHDECLRMFSGLKSRKARNLQSFSSVA